MKRPYDPETASLSIELNAAAGAETREIGEGLNVDLDVGRRPVGVELDHASIELDLGTLETGALLFHSTKAA